MDYSFILNRSKSLFEEDIEKFENFLSDLIKSSRLLVIGGAGSIGMAVTNEIFKREPNKLHIVDLSENNLVELVRMLRSSSISLKKNIKNVELKTFAIDSGSKEFEVFIKSQEPYDYIFNLSALKHVRSEKDPYTLMRLINVNIFNTVNNLNSVFNSRNFKNYFCISSDKATNPVSLMGASKKIMENFLMRESESKKITMSRFANVAFSDGSLLFGFTQRILKKQPIAAPNDVKRYFISPQESGEICLLSGLLGNNRDIFFPKMDLERDTIKFSEIAKKFLETLGYEYFECESEEHAIRDASHLISKKKWPCFFSESNTTGEKDYEEFYNQDEKVDLSRFLKLGVIESKAKYNSTLLDNFYKDLMHLLNKEKWDKLELVEIIEKALPDYKHNELGFDLDQKM